MTVLAFVENYSAVDKQGAWSEAYPEEDGSTGEQRRRFSSRTHHGPIGSKLLEVPFEGRSCVAAATPPPLRINILLHHPRYYHL